MIDLRPLGNPRPVWKTAGGKDGWGRAGIPGAGSPGRGGGAEASGLWGMLTGREEGHGGHEHVLGLLELESSQCPMKAKEQL